VRSGLSRKGRKEMQAQCSVARLDRGPRSDYHHWQLQSWSANERRGRREVEVPLHRNECTKCGRVFRVLELSGTESEAACPACGGHETRRLLPRVAIQFKGSGFYRTDHARRAGGNDPEGGPPVESEAAVPAVPASES
jgi:putative FmdB family regulatory protein